MLTGSITNLEAKREAFADADLFVLPSHSENFSQALFEAMVAGLPALISQEVDYAREVQSQGAGMAVRPDSGEFARAIMGLLHNTELRQNMGINARKMASAYPWELCGERLAGTLRSILAHEDFSPPNF